MTPGPQLLEGIRQIVRARAASRAEQRFARPFPGREEAGPAAAPAPTVWAEIPGAAQAEAAGGTLLSIRREVDELVPGVDLARELRDALERLNAVPDEELPRGLEPARTARLADLAVMDLETTGFWGCPVLLAGLLHMEDGVLVTRQLLARDYPEERAVLAATLQALAPRRLLVSFNGKSYDVPAFRERCAVHRVADTVTASLAHVDILHPARRRWRGRFEDCRLTTLERRVVGFTRSGDVPSHEVPDRFHRFIATGDAAHLLPVLHHGRVDLLTTARLFARLAFPPRPDEAD